VRRPLWRRCDIPTPKWKHVATLGLGWKNVDFSTRWRLIGQVSEDADTQIQTNRIPPSATSTKPPRSA
jgi:hypothetical protein